jgi:hypothetical protein
MYIKKIAQAARVCYVCIAAYKQYYYYVYYMTHHYSNIVQHTYYNSTDKRKIVGLAVTSLDWLYSQQGFGTSPRLRGRMRELCAHLDR